MTGKQSVAERATTYITIETLDNGNFRATQRDVDLIGLGSNPAEAVQNFAELVNDTIYGEDHDE